MRFGAISAAGAPLFSISWLTMIFWEIVAPKLGVSTISYTTAMLVTITLWLVVAPLAAAAARIGGGRRRGC